MLRIPLCVPAEPLLRMRMRPAGRSASSKMTMRRSTGTEQASSISRTDSPDRFI